DTGGLQLDETADPFLAAWEAGLAGDTTLYRNHVKAAADFLVANGPETPSSVERWEEQTGYSPSTMADEVAGLVAAASIAQAQGDPQSARLFLATADDFLRLTLKTTVTTDGPLSSSPYFMRLDKTGDPDQAGVSYSLGNGNNTPVDQRSVIDQGFLELTRLGELPAGVPLVTSSLGVVARAIDVSTPSGTGTLRYNGDGYGDCEAGTVTNPADPADTTSTCSTTGAPWAPTSTGTGHPWPVLSGEDGEYQVLAGDLPAATADLDFMLGSASGVGLVPEQVWDFAGVPPSSYGSAPATASIGFVDGQPDGSAAPLTWAQAQLLRLIRDMAEGSLVDQPSVVAKRYLAGPPALAPLTVTAPLAVSGGNVPPDMARPSATVDSTGLTVTATTVPGATVDVAVTGTGLGASAPTTTITTATAGTDGGVSVPVDLQPGTNSVEVASSAPGATNEALFTVDNLLVPGTVVLDAPAPPDGGNGPGTYAYPTATNAPGVPTFPPGAFKLSGLTVIDSGSTVTFQVGIANMVSTFGQPDGAQLVDLYIHAPDGEVPAGELESTAPAGYWNYSVAPADAWDQLIEVDGFGTDLWVTPATTSSTVPGIGHQYQPNSPVVGSPEISVASLSPTANGYTPGVISVTVPASLLGAPANGGSWSGWAFTVTLTGQDGTGGGNDDARVFTATPGQYSFGVCLPGGTSPICAVAPSQVPYVMDMVPPAGVDVRAELDPLPGPVVVHGVTVPELPGRGPRRPPAAQPPPP
ncbi:MAG: glucodextranase DOMON-like domain-containing protein, partial [Acidimicrobiales bacterium]